MRHRAWPVFIIAGLGERQPRMIVNTDLHKRPASPFGLALFWITGDALAGCIALSQMFHIKMDQVAEMIACVPPDWLGGLQIALPAERSR